MAIAMRRGNSQGFTLIEMMLVAFLMGLAAMIVVPSFGGNEKGKLEQEAKRFVALLELLSEEAIMSGKDYGLLIDKHSYQFFQLDDNDQWQTLEEDDIYKEVDLSELAKLELKLDGFSWGGEVKKGQDLGLFNNDLFEDDFIEEEDEEEKRPQPQLFLFASGEMSAFTLSFELIRAEEPETLFKAVGLSSGQLYFLKPEDEKWQEY